jgi:hypothetical protein
MTKVGSSIARSIQTLSPSAWGWLSTTIHFSTPSLNVHLRNLPQERRTSGWGFCAIRLLRMGGFAGFTPCGNGMGFLSSFPNTGA